MTTLSDNILELEKKATKYEDCLRAVSASSPGFKPHTGNLIFDYIEHLQKRVACEVQNGRDQNNRIHRLEHQLKVAENCERQHTLAAGQAEAWEHVAKALNKYFPGWGEARQIPMEAAATAIEQAASRTNHFLDETVKLTTECNKATDQALQLSHASVDLRRRIDELIKEVSDRDCQISNLKATIMDMASSENHMNLMGIVRAIRDQLPDNPTTDSIRQSLSNLIGGPLSS